jgi:hypothetical protein
MKFLTIFGLVAAFLFGFDYADGPANVDRPTSTVNFVANAFRNTSDSNIVPIKGPNNICIVDTSDYTYTQIASCINEQPNWLRVRIYGANTP